MNEVAIVVNGISNFGKSNISPTQTARNIGSNSNHDPVKDNQGEVHNGSLNAIENLLM